MCYFNSLFVVSLIPERFTSPLRANLLVGRLPGHVVAANKGNATDSMPTSLPEGAAGRIVKPAEDDATPQLTRR